VTSLKPLTLVEDPNIMTDQLQNAREDAVNARNELAKAKLKHAEELKELKASLEAKHKKEFEALRLLWDKDRDELRKAETEVRELRKEDREDEIENRNETDNKTDAGMLVAQFEKLHEIARSDFTINTNGCFFFSSGVNASRKFKQVNSSLELEVERLKELSNMQDQLEALVDLVLGYTQNLAKIIEEKARSLNYWEESSHKLRQENDNKEPLYLKGVDTRLGFWEKSKTAILNIPRENLDQAVIEAGNAAAHEPNVAADVALFHCGVLKGDDEIAIFEKIYGDRLDNCRAVICSHPTHCKLIESEATIRLKISEHSWTKASAQWDEWSNLCRVMWTSIGKSNGVRSEEVRISDLSMTTRDCKI
jgi:hypothetical protein